MAYVFCSTVVCVLITLTTLITLFTLQPWSTVLSLVSVLAGRRRAAITNATN